MSPAASDATPQPDVSVTAAFAGATVLLTGATGYVGSLVLEQLLRLCPGVERILILVRPKRGRCPAERRRQLLDGGLFHQLWRQPALLNKVSSSFSIHCPPHRCRRNAAVSIGRKCHSRVMPCRCAAVCTMPFTIYAAHP